MTQYTGLFLFTASVNTQAEYHPQECTSYFLRHSRQLRGNQKLVSRRCLVVVILFITLWVKLSNKIPPGSKSIFQPPEYLSIVSIHGERVQRESLRSRRRSRPRSGLKTYKTILYLIPRTTVTSLSAPKDTRCKTHPLYINPGVSF